MNTSMVLYPFGHKNVAHQHCKPDMLLFCVVILAQGTYLSMHTATCTGPVSCPSGTANPWLHSTCSSSSLLKPSRWQVHAP